MKFILILFVIAGFVSCESKTSSFSLTKRDVQKLLNNPEPARQMLKEGSVEGFVSVPAEGFFQRLFVGFKAAGDCEIIVYENNAVSVSFLGSRTFDLTEIKGYPLFIAELDRNQILIVQHNSGRVVSAVQTIYDSRGRVVYQSFGAGDYIQECISK